MATQYNEGAPQCPSCSYAMTSDDMLNQSEANLFDIAPNEDRAAVKCPSCDIEYWVQGGYRPTYTTALAEEELRRLTLKVRGSRAKRGHPKAQLLGCPLDRIVR